MFEQMAEPKEKKPTDYTGVIVGVIVVPVVLLFIHLGKEDVGRSVSIGLVTTLIAIRIRWDLRKHFWFWGTIVVLSLLQLPLVFALRWPSGWIPAIGTLPIALVDCLVILGGVRLVEKLMTKNKGFDEPV